MTPLSVPDDVATLLGAIAQRDPLGAFRAVLRLAQDVPLEQLRGALEVDAIRRANEKADAVERARFGLVEAP